MAGASLAFLPPRLSAALPRTRNHPCEGRNIMNLLHATRAPLAGRTAADVMTPNPLSIRESASVAEPLRFLTNKGFSAARVIDERGRPIGVLSRADILVFNRERATTEEPVAAYYGHA